MFDQLLDEMRTHSTEWLHAERFEVVAEQRRLHSRELAITRVLDERGQIDEAMVAGDGVSARTARETIETARALEVLPEVADAACAGRLSAEQLAPAAQLAADRDGGEWAERAQRMSPKDLQREARKQREVPLETSRARHAARSLRMWWDDDHGMLHLRGELPDALGAEFEAAINRITDRMRPPKGRPFASRQHRRADALVEMCQAWKHADPGPTAAKPLLIAEVPMHGPATIAGVPLPAAIVEQLRASASVEPVLVDGCGDPVKIGKRSRGLSPKIQRAVLLRDGHCRCSLGCELRYGLQVHHRRPRSWGGADDLDNLVAVAPSHHPMFVPHGPYVLVGNPNRPDGLRTVHIDDLTAEERAEIGHPPPRDGPSP